MIDNTEGSKIEDMKEARRQFNESTVYSTEYYQAQQEILKIKNTNYLELIKQAITEEESESTKDHGMEINIKAKIMEKIEQMKESTADYPPKAWDESNNPKYL